MPIITISRGSYSYGKETAEKAAKKLGYGCISRDILLAASEHYNIPEIKLEGAMGSGPSIFDRLTHGKERYIAYIRAALLEYLREDNMVYYGLAGHFFLKGVSHVLKVRIIADMEDRTRIVMDREKMSEKNALKTLKEYDEQRRKWSMYLYGIDTHDPSLYDLVIHIKKITADDAADIICHTVKRDSFQTTVASQKTIDNLALAAEVKAAAISISPGVEVYADEGKISIKTRVHEFDEMEIVSHLRKAALEINGVKDVSIDVLPATLYTD
jgi:cytidylate kinase